MCTHLFFLQVDCDRLVSSPFQTSSSFIITITMGKSFLVWFGVFGQLKRSFTRTAGWREWSFLFFKRQSTNTRGNTALVLKEGGSLCLIVFWIIFTGHGFY